MPPIPPAGFPIYPYTPLQNTTQSFANSMFSQPPSLIPPVSVQFRPHEAITRELSAQFIGESGPPRPSYGESYNQRENASQQQSQSFSEYEMQDSYEENRQKYNDSRAFSRESAFVGGSYGSNGSQHFVDGVGGQQHYSESGQHYIDGGSQHYSDSTYQSGMPFRTTALNKRGFSNRSSRPLPPPPQYQQSRQVRHHPYQRR